jgi:hypothetical protein
VNFHLRAGDVRIPEYDFEKSSVEIKRLSDNLYRDKANEFIDWLSDLGLLSKKATPERRQRVASLLADHFSSEVYFSVTQDRDFRQFDKINTVKSF